MKQRHVRYTETAQDHVWREESGGQLAWRGPSPDQGKVVWEDLLQRSAEGAGRLRRSPKQEFDFHGLERKDNPPAVRAVEDPSVEKRRDVAHVFLYGHLPVCKDDLM